jgi:hypothetical protein
MLHSCAEGGQLRFSFLTLSCLALQKKQEDRADDEEEEEDNGDGDVLRDAPVGEKDVSAFTNFDPKKMLDGQVRAAPSFLFLNERFGEKGRV